MKIAIIGVGNIGGRLAQAWAKKGHELVLGVRDVADKDVKKLVADCGSKTRAVTVAESVKDVDVVALAVPFKAVEETLAAIGALAGKILIDCTNPIGATLKEPSGAAFIAKRLPKAHVVKSFNSQGAENLAEPVFDGMAASNFYCGDDKKAKATVRALIEDIGFDAIDAGGLDKANLLESAAYLWFATVAATGTRHTAFRVLRAKS